MLPYTRAEYIQNEWHEAYVEYSPSKYASTKEALTHPVFVEKLPLILFDRPKQALEVAKAFAKAWCNIHPECKDRCSWSVTTGVAGVNSIMQTFVM